MKEQRRGTSASFLPSILLVVAGLIIILLCNVIMKDWLIICFGVRVFKFVQMAGAIIAGIGIIIVMIQVIFFLKIKNRQRQEREQALERERAQSQTMSEYAENSASPELTRRMLLQLCQTNPDFENLVEQCLEQMDRMDRLQERQGILIKTNSAIYLKDTVAVLDNVERRICQNFQNIINLCIVADDSKCLDGYKVNTNLDDNLKKLADAKKLLDVSAAWVNEYNRNQNQSDRSEVETWIEVIQKSLKEG